uniref:Receptor-like serine/threonine-protein kinase n=1 Tax=Kalanchoe fedtschenkoi TaxID=63787 RepID=A0A7N1A3S6_KALFE
MGSIFIILVLVFLPSCFFSPVTCSEYIYPNFTASNFQFIDKAGTFLLSRNGTFKAAMFNPGAEQARFYLCIIHVVSNTVIWSANRDSPVSISGNMHLTPNGISIQDEDGKGKWSTPVLKSAVFSLQLTETGNLVLLDRSNGSLWESFLSPTDTLVIGQQLRVGTVLTSSVADADLSTGDYILAVGGSDALLQWHGNTYWQLSMETTAYKNTNHEVQYLAMNTTGLYLFGVNGSEVVVQVIFSPSEFRVAKLNYNGQLVVTSFSDTIQKQELVSPRDACRTPYICHKIGLCTNNAALSLPTCSCPSNFHGNSKDSGSCVPRDTSYSLSSACNSTNNNSVFNSSGVSYITLGNGLEYFALDFLQPVTYGVNISSCKYICTMDCSCLGFFYESSSGSCYALQKELGSIMSNSDPDGDVLGYIKVINASALGNSGDNNGSLDPGQDFPLIALVLLPFTGVSVVITIGFLVWRRQKVTQIRVFKDIKLAYPRFSSSSGDMDIFSIPGLPRKFEYEELQAATENFKNQIGSGGFGAVYKGSLSDKTVVAVKKITNIGIRGKREFCSEIATIGNIHHVNLVKLKGFCTYGSQYLLIYEYMNRSSLDRTLFGNGPVLEWQERVEIALGTARGLAYLHSSCEQKIIHCDVKPENILLHDNFQAKISDFGLSKLLSAEQSSHFTTMRGTRGYLAPEWLTSSTISEKTDVYSFGMVLLELVSGRKNCSTSAQNTSVNDDNESNGGQSSISSRSNLVYFPLFALEMHEKGRYLELADSRLHGRVLSEDVEKLVRIALCCVHEEPVLRPSMVSVVGMLEGGMPVGRPRVESLSFLRFYGRRFAEASTIEETGGQTLGRSSSVAGMHISHSHMSAQQLSGPR